MMVVVHPLLGLLWPSPVRKRFHGKGVGYAGGFLEMSDGPLHAHGEFLRLVHGQLCRIGSCDEVYSL